MSISPVVVNLRIWVCIRGSGLRVFGFRGSDLGKFGFQCFGLTNAGSEFQVALSGFPHHAHTFF